jgi:hypothetical protein
MTNNQKIIYFANTPPESEKGSSIEKLNEFISNPDIDAKSISAAQFGILLLYEERQYQIIFNNKCY